MKQKYNQEKKYYIYFLVIAFCCFLYGIRIMMIHSGTKFYTVWYVIGILFLALSYVSKKHLWKKVPSLIRKLVYIFLAASLLVFLFIESLIMTRFFDKGDDNLDYIIVLGAQVKPEGPSYVLKKRLDAALEYLYDNPNTICVVSGGQGYNEPFSEADGMAEYLTNNGIDPVRIIKETSSTSTSENIINSMKLIDCNSSIGVVTNNFHVYRAVKTAERCGLDNVCGIAGKMSVIFLPNNMLREFLAIIKFMIIG